MKATRQPPRDASFLHARASPSKPNAGPPPDGGTHYGTDFRPFDRAAYSRVRTNRIEAAIGVASNTKGNIMSDDNNTKARPTHRIYSVTKNGDSKPNWQEIGAAWPHKDGKGFNLKFTARPLDGAEIVLRVATPKKEAA